MRQFRPGLTMLAAAALAWGLAAVPTQAPLAAAPSAPRTAFIVNSTADKPDLYPGNGQCETVLAGACTLRAALEEANAFAGSDTITFSVTGAIQLGSGLPVITETLSINGPGAEQLAVAGDGSTPVFKFVRYEVGTAFAVSGLTLTGGSGLAGGGIYQEGPASLTISGVIISGNAASNFGGGVYHEGPASILNSTIRDNRAGRLGGGLYSAGPVELIGSTIVANRIQGLALATPAGAPDSQAGGGLFAMDWLTLTASAVLSNTIFSDMAGGQTTNCAPVLMGGGPPPAARGYGLFIGESGGLITDSQIRGNQSPSPCAANAPLGDVPAGGGIYNLNGPLTVVDSAITNNRAGYGAGVVNEGGQLELIDTLVSGNLATAAGGGIAHHGGTLLLDNTQVRGNTVNGNGGGLMIDSGPVLIRDSEIMGNEASGQGGGLAIEASAGVTITASAIYSNAANYGGGLASNGALHLSDVTLSHNAAQSDGGGLYTGPLGAAVLRHVTLAYNVADADSSTSGAGGGLYVQTPTTTLINTLVAMNVDRSAESPDCGGTLISGGYNLIQSTAGCTFAAATGDQVNVVGAGLLPLADNGGNTLTHALAPTSLALNAASETGCTPADQRGMPRPAGAGCDIGAFELSYALFLTFLSR